MGAKRTLRNKLTNSGRKPSLKKGTPFRRTTTTTVTAGEYQVVHTFHTTKGRPRWRILPAAKPTEGG